MRFSTSEALDGVLLGRLLAPRDQPWEACTVLLLGVIVALLVALYLEALAARHVAGRQAAPPRRAPEQVGQT